MEHVTTTGKATGTRRLESEVRRSAKYWCIEASVCELGVIEPLVMFPDPPGRLWAVDRETGKVTELKPGGRDRLDKPRFAREAVYLPKADLVRFGALVKSVEKLLVPFYDPKRNKWVLADVPGAKVFNASRKEPGASVDLGLVYDPNRELVFAVLCHLEPGAVRVLRLDGTTLKRIGP